MPTLAWVLAAGVAMALLALTGSLTLLLPERASSLQRRPVQMSQVSM